MRRRNQGIVITQTHKDRYLELSFNLTVDHVFLTKVEIWMRKDGQIAEYPCFWDGPKFVCRIVAEKGTYQVVVAKDGVRQKTKRTNVTITDDYDTDFVGVNGGGLTLGAAKYYPVGVNCAYGMGNDYEFGNGPAGVAHYWRTFEPMAEYGYNYARLLLGNGLSLWEDKNGIGEIPGDFNLEAAETLDQIIELAHDNGIYLHLTLDHRALTSLQLPQTYGKTPSEQAQFRALWNQSKWNGTVTHPREVFSQQHSKDIFHARNRYLIARYGYSPAFAIIELCAEGYLWDFFKEQPEKFEAWNIEMKDGIKAIWGGVVGTGDGLGFHPDMDIYAPHIHPGINKSQITAEIGTDAGIYNHWRHRQTEYLQEGHMSAGGYGQMLSEAIGKTNVDYYRQRVLHDRFGMWESMFNVGALGVMAPWDERAAWPHYQGPEICAPIVQAAKIVAKGDWTYKLIDDGVIVQHILMDGIKRCIYAFDRANKFKEKDGLPEYSIDAQGFAIDTETGVKKSVSGLVKFRRDIFIFE